MATQRNTEPFARWVRQLSSRTPEEAAFAACELGRLSCGSDCKVDLVVSAGAIPPLINLLSSPHALVQEHAVGTLGTLASYPSIRAAIPAAVAVPAVLRLLRKGSLEVQRNAADALAHLAYECSGNKATIVGAGAIPLLERLCGSSCNVVQQYAARALCFVAAGNRQFEPLIATRALPTLVRQLKPGVKVDASSRKWFTNIARHWLERVPDGGGSSGAGDTCGTDPTQSVLQHSALKILCEVMVDDSFSACKAVSFLMTAGVREAVRALVQSADWFVKEIAARLLDGMMHRDSDTATDITEGGVVPLLVGLLRCPSKLMCGAAIAALSSLIEEDRGDVAVFIALGGLEAVAALIDIPTQQEHALLLLQDLIGCSDALLDPAVAAAAASSGILAAVVRQLQSNDQEIVLSAMVSLTGLLEGDSSNQVAALTEGAVPLLLALLQHEGTLVQNVAAGALLALVRNNDDNISAVTAAGGIESVVAAMRSNESGELHCHAGLLDLLAGSHYDCQAAAIAAGAIPALVSLLKGSNEEAQVAAAFALSTLAESVSTSDVVAGITTMQNSSVVGTVSHRGVWHAAAEAVPVLVSLLHHNNTDIQESGASALSNMFGKSSAVADAFEAAHGRTVVMSIMRSSSPDMQTLASTLLHNFQRSSSYRSLE